MGKNSGWNGIYTVADLFFDMSKILFCAEDKNFFYVNSKNDLLDLEKKCFDDDCSKEKEIVLQSDLDLSKSKFKYLRIFSGDFDGQNYKISGLKFLGNKSAFGFFYRLGEHAKVKSLELDMNFDSGSAQKNIGGLATKNFGFIENCIFNGEIKGK